MNDNCMLLTIIAAVMVSGCTRKVDENVTVSANEENTNRLIKETSPYLLQHAHNPVDWYPWGDEAFEQAVQQDKPIFVSIGYSSCHWCHVMERESFEDESLAELLNEHFISIKVDREERPDIDAIYMAAVQAMTGSGGWPLNVFLTHDRKPFFGGTYFPPDSRRGGTPFRDVLLHISRAWNERRSDIEVGARELTEAIDSMDEPETYGGVGTLDSEKAAVAALSRSFNSATGGFGQAPKFPQPAGLSFLLMHHAETGDGRSLDMVTSTLDAMARGGIFDHLGGGFHRYTVDADWLIPHFEKMLYDSAQLARVYLEAYQVTGKELYANTARETLEYVIRDMTDKTGGFHAAEDADSEGEEGKFYVWSIDKIEDVLGSDADDFIKYYGVTRGGNFEGKNILYIGSRKSEPADLKVARAKLLRERENRIRPGKDYKVIAAWNGLMISAMVKGYQVLHDRRYLDSGTKAARFIQETMTRDGVLHRTYAGDRLGVQGFLDDYANMAAAYLDLYEATGETDWFDAATSLVERMVTLFSDQEGGGFFYTSGDDSSVLIRRKGYLDNALPSGNSVAVLVLERFGRLTGNDKYEQLAAGILEDSRQMLSAVPQGMLNMVAADLYTKSEPVEVVIIGEKGGKDTEALLEVVAKSYVPGVSLIVADSDDPGYSALQKKIPLLEGRESLDGKATAYVCVNRACRLPVTDTAALENELKSALP